MTGREPRHLRSVPPPNSPDDDPEPPDGDDPEPPEETDTRVLLW
ncbi:hypothetical protein [Mycobacterium sp. EPa45]|nr:hypothetical protein [Mycobacterium sp. EPa45]